MAAECWLAAVLSVFLDRYGYDLLVIDALLIPEPRSSSLFREPRSSRLFREPRTANSGSSANRESRTANRDRAISR
jgi:hypothetical protein